MSAVAIARHRPADNPFASHRTEALAFRRDGATLEDLPRRLEDLGGRAAIVGPEGSGKTTLLEELASALPGEPVQVWIGGGCRRPWRTVRAQLPEPVTPIHAVLVDGAEQLGPIGWRRLLLATRRARFLVATLHRPGLLPTLIECHTDQALLRELVGELTPADASKLAPSLGQLFERNGGNIRLCLRDLYDVYAGRVSGGEREKGRKGDPPTLP
jgi:energy-coupling factor transporter ATP-binding protein EcfA2